MFTQSVVVFAIVLTLLQHLLKIVLMKSVSVTESWYELKLFNTLMVLEHLQ